MSLKVAFIGAGYMAREHVKAFVALSDVMTVGIYSRTKAKAEALATEFAIPLVATSIADLYEQTEPDLVVVSVNIVPARDVLLECIGYGVPLLTEKPIALNFEQSLEVRNVAHAAGVPVWVGLNRRFYDATRLALSGLEKCSGPRIIQVFDQQDRQFALDSGHPKLVVDNWMYAASIHVIDYLLAFGRGSVIGVDVHHAYNSEAPTLVNATVHFDSGDTGLYTAIWDAPGPWACCVTTREVRWEMQPLESARWCHRGSRQWNSAPISEKDRNFKAGVYNQASTIVKALLDGNYDQGVGIDEAMRTTQLVSDLYGIPATI